MGAVGAVVFLFLAVTTTVAIVRRYRFNAKAARARAQTARPDPGWPAPPLGSPPNPAWPAPPLGGPPNSAWPAPPLGDPPNPAWAARPVRPSAGLRYAEDRTLGLARPIGISAGVFGLATATFVGLQVTGQVQATWLPIVFMFFSGVVLLGTLISSKPGIRVRDGAIVLGHVAYAERHPIPGFSEKMGVPHFVATLAFDDILEVRFLRGPQAIAARNGIRAGAPPRVTSGRKPSRARKRVLGLFYAGGLPDAMYIRIRPDRTVPIPLVVTPAGVGNTTTFSTTWSGPEFLIGTRHPEALQQAVIDAVNAYQLAGGHPISVVPGPPVPPGAAGKRPAPWGQRGPAAR